MQAYIDVNAHNVLFNLYFSYKKLEPNNPLFKLHYIINSSLCQKLMTFRIIAFVENFTTLSYNFHCKYLRVEFSNVFYAGAFLLDCDSVLFPSINILQSIHIIMPPL